MNVEVIADTGPDGRAQRWNLLDGALHALRDGDFEATIAEGTRFGRLVVRADGPEVVIDGTSTPEELVDLVTTRAANRSNALRLLDALRSRAGVWIVLCLDAAGLTIAHVARRAA